MKQPHQQKRGQHPPVLNILGYLYAPAASSAPGAPVLQRSRHTITKITKLCGCTRMAVNRLRDAFDEGGLEAVHALKWGKGASFKEKLSTEEVAWLVQPETLKHQALMSIAQRTGAFNAKFEKEIKFYDVRNLFRGVGISKQQFRRCMGPPKPTEKAMAKQQQYLDTTKEKLEELT